MWRSGMTDEQGTKPIPKWQRFLGENLSSLIIPMPKCEKPTLTEYIEENSKLLSALGVFLGLSVFANNLVDKGIGANNLADKGMARLLSFLLFTLGVLIYFELMRNFRWFSWYARIAMFRDVLTLSMFAFIYVYVKMFYPFLLAYLYMAAGIMGLLIAYVIVQAAIRWIFRRSWFRGLNLRAREVLIPTFGGLSPSASLCSSISTTKTLSCRPRRYLVVAVRVYACCADGASLSGLRTTRPEGQRSRR
jgi:hypothetical protein